ncbi:MAG: GNAT family N-acetyltransferase [Verrucomicrobia bacterium]|nr:GNAT family N-acetyltransferase [Verrucomicrobiota bacterium]
MYTFRSFSLDDIPLVHEWFNRPHVQEFYSLRAWSIEDVTKKFMEEKPIWKWIVDDDSRPIGYIQHYRVLDFPWKDGERIVHFEEAIEKNAAGLDLFLGDPESIGMGSCILLQFLEKHIWPQFHYCIVDPDVRNVRSIKMFKKCGFVPMQRIATVDALGRKAELELMAASCPSFFCHEQ